jgi:hypothetical protein
MEAKDRPPMIMPADTERARQIDERITRQIAQPEPKPKRARPRQHRGGRPDVVRRAAADFWTRLSDADRRWSNMKLAMIYTSEGGRPGKVDTVRKHIANLREEDAKVI